LDPKRPKEPNLTCSSNNINNIAIFGIIVNQVVTIVGVPSYTSGDQLCKGAAAILNRNPINIKLNPKLILRRTPHSCDSCASASPPLE
jgi:hypothetical protein